MVNRVLPRKLGRDLRQRWGPIASLLLIVMVGVGDPARFEWTPLYFKEINLVGSSGYAMETFGGRRLHAFELFLELVASGRIDPAPLITHRFGLSEYKTGFLTARQKDRHRSIKVLLEP